MARPGVTYAEIAEAASHLIGQGKNPTIEQIRLFLGTGSSTTIANHLKQWKEQQQGTSLLAAKENIPTELIEMVKGLWERLMDLSQSKMSEAETNFTATISELEQVAEKYKANNQRWQQLFNQWQQEKEKISNDKLSLEQAVIMLQKDRGNLQVTLASQQQQTEEKQQRISELHQLHKQAQDNLEHYREAAREQRLIEQQQYEQQRTALQTENEQLKDRYLQINEKASFLQQQLSNLQQKYHALETNHCQQGEHLEQHKSHIVKLEKNIHEQQHANQHWQQQHQLAQKIADEKTIIQIDLQTELKVITTQLNEAKHFIKDLQEQNKLLANEKWILAQEKAQLEGQFKQMQRLVPAT